MNYSIFVIGDYEHLGFLFKFEKQIYRKEVIVDVRKYFFCLCCFLYSYLLLMRERVINPVGIYMFKVNNRNTRTRCERCTKLIIKTPERRHWRLYCCGLFSLWYVSIVNFGQVNADWESSHVMRQRFKDLRDCEGVLCQRENRYFFR